MRRWLTIAVLLAVPSTSWAATSCARPDTAFDKFLTQFANDRAFQLERIVFPLRVVVGDAKAPANEKWDRQRVTKLPPPLLVPRAWHTWITAPAPPRRTPSSVSSFADTRYSPSP